MNDPVEIQRRIERLVKRVRRRDDYGKLLARGEVIRSIDEIADPNAWRSEIKRQARADRIKVRTGQTKHIVWAVLHRPPAEDQLDSTSRYFRLLDVLKSRSDVGGHRLRVLVRDGDEVIVQCKQCEAIGYGEATEEGMVVGGPALDDECPDPLPRDPNDLEWL